MKILITGGVGFIGSNLAYSLLGQGAQVTIYDNLSRKMVKNNLKWLKENTDSGKLKILINDVRDRDNLNKAIKNKDVIFHLAAQTTITGSIKSPLDDFEVNTIGAINVLEGIKIYNPDALAIYSSTNKVYGSMENAGERIKKINISYNFRGWNIRSTYPMAVKPIRAVQFHPFDQTPYPGSPNALEFFMYGKNKINTILMPEGLIKIFHKHGIR